MCTQHLGEPSEIAAYKAFEACSKTIAGILHEWADNHREKLYSDLEQAHEYVTKAGEALRVIARLYQAIANGDNPYRTESITEIDLEKARSESLNDIDIAARSSQALYPSCWQALQQGQQISLHQEKLQTLAAELYCIYYDILYNYMKEQNTPESYFSCIFDSKKILPEPQQIPTS